MHVSELLEQTKDSRDVVRVRRSQVVVSHTNQFFTLISNKLAETIGNFDVPSVAVYHRNVLRFHFKLRGLQFLAKCFKGRSGIRLSFWHCGYIRIRTKIQALRFL